MVAVRTGPEVDPARPPSPNLSHPFRTVADMEIVLVIIVVIAVVGALGACLAAGVAVARRQGDEARDRAELERDAAVEAAVRALRAETDQVVRAAVETTVELADAKLDGRLRTQGGQIETHLQHLSKSLGEVGQLVHGLQRDRVDQHREFTERLADQARRTTDLAEATGDLRTLLANPTARGKWGERMADDVLRAAGFQEGINYHRQQAAGGGVPDFRFPLPKGLEVRMDVKFPIDNFLRHQSAASEADRERSRTAFLRDVRARVKELAKREYTGQETVDYVLLFIPNEAVYSFMLEHDDELIDQALGQRVVLCSPFTLFGVLAVIRQATDAFALERQTGEILTCLADFRDEWGRFTTHLDKMGKKLAETANVYDELNGPRRRQLQRRLDKVDQIEETPPTERPHLREVRAG